MNFSFLLPIFHILGKTKRIYIEIMFFIYLMRMKSLFLTETFLFADWRPIICYLWMLCTYRLNWMNYSVFAVGMRNLYFFENYELHILGAVSPTGKFCLSLIVVSSHEDWVSQVSILNYLKSLGLKPGYFMVKRSMIIVFEKIIYPL